MAEKVDNKSLWNEAAKVGIVFGLFSSVCLVLKEASALTGSTLLVKIAAAVLWAVEFFGCILLMKKYMLDLMEKYSGLTYRQLYLFGSHIGLLSGLILAAVDAFIITKIPQETVAQVMDELASGMGGLGASGTQQMEQEVMDYLPAFTFFGQWLYCYMYGTFLSAILSRYIFLSKARDDINNDIDNQQQ